VLLGGWPGMSNLNILFQAGNLLLWIPGVLFGAIVLIASRRSKHLLTYPALLTGAGLIFYLVIWISGSGIQDAREMGLLLEPFPPGTLWKPLDVSLLAQANWSLIFSQAS